MNKNKNLLVFIFPTIFIAIFFCGLTFIAPHLNWYTIGLPIAFFVLVILNFMLYFQLIRGEMLDKLPDIKPDLDKPIPVSAEDKIKYEAILAYIGEGLVVIDKAGKIITFNKAAEALLGWKEHEVLGRELTEVIRIDYKTSISESRLTPSKQSSL